MSRPAARSFSMRRMMSPLWPCTSTPSALMCATCTGRRAWRRRAIGFAELVDAQGAEARVHGDVGSNGRRSQALRLRGDVEAAEAVIADDRGGHALREKGNVQALARIGGMQVGIGVGVRVDE